MATLPGVRHGFYGRRGGVSRGGFAELNCSEVQGDAPERVAANRELILNDLGGIKIYTNEQIHSDSTRVINADSVAEFKGDGLITQARGLVLGILTADCAPVLFADADASVIGAAHAGWRGALAGITDAVLKQMLSCGARRENITAAIGPAIGFNSYQVGAEFKTQFESESPIASAECFQPRADKYNFDLCKYIKSRLATAGITNIDTLSADTYADPNLFSHRRAQHKNATECGRQLSTLMLI